MGFGRKGVDFLKSFVWCMCPGRCDVGVPVDVAAGAGVETNVDFLASVIKCGRRTSK